MTGRGNLGRDLARLRPTTPPSRPLLGQVASATTVSIAGSEVPVLWEHPEAVPLVGDRVRCDLIDGTMVAGPVVTPTRPTAPTPPGRIGTVAAVTTPTLSVTVSGVTHTGCPCVTGTYVVGDKVLLTWEAGYTSPTVLGKTGATAANPTGPATDPDPSTVPTAPTMPTTTKGATTEVFRASESRTWSESKGGWSSYYGPHAYQGTWDGQTYSGFWWAASRLRSTLTGRTVTAASIWVPARRRAGNYNASGALHVGTHTQRTRGEAKPTWTALFDTTLPAGWDGGWVTIPDANLGALVTVLAAGGYVGIVGSPYIGVVGVGSTDGTDPMSMAVRLTHAPA